MKNSEFIRQIRLRYKWILFFSLCAFIVGSIIYSRYSEKSKGEVTIIIPLPSTIQDKGASDAERYAFALQNAVTANRLLNFIYSDAMIKHINDKFNLYSLYDIDKDKLYSKNILMKTFQENVKLERESDEMAKIVFFNKNEIVAADIVNEIVAKLISMNKQYVLTSISQRRNLYEGMLGEINTEVKGQISLLQGVVSDFQAQSNMSERNFDKLDMQVGAAASEVYKMTSEIVRIQQYYKWSQIAMEKSFQDNVFIINSAFPYKAPTNYLKIFFAGLTSAILMISLTCTIIYLYFYTRIQIHNMATEI